MARVISIHSFRRGTGKSSVTANMATLLASEGRRVGIVDTNFQWPSMHVLFGLSENRIVASLNDYLKGRCDIEQAVHDVTPDMVNAAQGKIFLVPSSREFHQIARLMHEGYDANVLSEGFHDLMETLALDVLLVDMPHGLNEETMLCLALSDTLAILLRLDHQDYAGTALTLEVARKLEVPQVLLLVNEVVPSFQRIDVQHQIEQLYGCEVGAVLPYVGEMMALVGTGIFSLQYPQHPVTESLKQLATQLME